MRRLIFSLILLTTLSAAAKAQTGLAEPGTLRLIQTVKASNLNRPWALGFLPDGSQLVSERVGRLQHIDLGGARHAIAGLPTDLVAEGQGGLLDLLIHPDFSLNRRLFFTYSKRQGSGLVTALARAQLDVSSAQLQNVETIFVMNRASPGGRHFGSRLVMARDATLFMTLGDRGDPGRAQDPFDHAGKVIRLHQDGSIPADNPFADGRQALPEIWSLGHRNAQGAALDPDSGRLWTLSHGPAGGDELNQPRAGLNYGWPLISYGQNYDGSGFNSGSRAPGLEQPVYYWDPSIAPSGLTFYDPPNPLIPAWSGRLLAGALKFQHLSVLDIRRQRVRGEQIYLQGMLGRIRDVRTGPDGAVWILTDSDQGQLIRLTQG